MAQLVKKDSYGKRIAGMDAWISVEKSYGKGQLWKKDSRDA